MEHGVAHAYFFAHLFPKSLTDFRSALEYLAAEVRGILFTGYREGLLSPGRIWRVVCLPTSYERIADRAC